MKDIKILLLFTFFALCGQIIFAQSFYRPWASYSPTKPQKPYQSINTTNNKLSSNKCYYRNYDYEPNQIITNLDISSEEVFSFFKRCCAEHPSRCVSNYIGKNNKTLLYTLVEKKAYRYIEWILNSGFVYDAYIDSWGIYNDIDGTMVPIRNFNAMMLAVLLAIGTAWLGVNKEVMNVVVMTPTTIMKAAAGIDAITGVNARKIV